MGRGPGGRGDPLNASLAQAVLSRDGHRVLMAADGPTALDMACRWQPDLVLLDVSLLRPMTGPRCGIASDATLDLIAKRLNPQVRASVFVAAR